MTSIKWNWPQTTSEFQKEKLGFWLWKLAWDEGCKHCRDAAFPHTHTHRWLSKAWFITTSPAFVLHTESEWAWKAAFKPPTFFLFLHSPWLRISACTHSHQTGRPATKTANYSAETEKDPPCYHCLRIRTYIHRGAAPSGAPGFQLSGSLKGTHVSVENLKGHLQTSHSRKHKAD